MVDHFHIWRRKSIWLLMGAAVCIALTGQSLVQLDGPTSLATAWITAALVIYVYGLDSLIDTLHPLRAMLSRKGLLLLPVLLSGLALAYRRQAETLVASLLILALGLSYAYPLPWKTRVLRLKDVTGLKSAWIGIGWALLVYLGAGDFHHLQAHWVASFVALQVMAGSVLRDLDDMDEDRLAGTRTLPLALGEGPTYLLLHALNLSSGIMLFTMPVAFAFGWFFVIAWRAANLEWLRLSEPGRFATQYMNLATCGLIFLIRMVYYVLD